MTLLMALATVVVVLVLIGLCVWVIETQIPMTEPFKMAVRVVMALGLVIWVLMWLLPFLLGQMHPMH